MANANNQSIQSDPDVLRSLADVQTRCFHLLEEAASVTTNAGAKSFIQLPNLYSPVGRWEIVAIGRRRMWRLLPLPHRVGPFTFFFTRRDYSALRSNGLNIVEVYDSSELIEWEEKELIDKLNDQGKWGPFLSDNDSLLHRLKRAIEKGDFENKSSNIKWQGGSRR